MFICVSQTNLNKFIRPLKAHFDITANLTYTFTFLRLNFNIQKDRILVTQNESINSLLRHFHDTTNYETPTTSDLYISQMMSPTILPPRT